MGEDAGSVFVVRNVANMVTGTDFNAMSAIQYAVGVLEVPHIIVCGHYDCGGVRASRENLDHAPPLENWLRSIRDVYRLHNKEVRAGGAKRRLPCKALLFLRWKYTLCRI
jgi:carbonic anhydrase